MAAEIDKYYPYRAGFSLRYDTQMDYSNDKVLMRFVNFRYEPIRYFQED